VGSTQKRALEMKNTRPRNRPPPSEAAVPSGDSAPFVPLGTCTRVLVSVDVRWRWKSIARQRTPYLLEGGDENGTAFGQHTELAGPGVAIAACVVPVWRVGREGKSQGSMSLGRTTTRRGEAIPQEGGEDEAGHGLGTEVKEVAVAHTHHLQPHDTQQRAKQSVCHLQPRHTNQ
jgi:hypothetical protein